MHRSKPVTFTPSENVEVTMQSEIDAGVYYDTVIEIHTAPGGFAIAGGTREAFLRELGEMIDRYRI